jgi:hypothetical protein
MGEWRYGSTILDFGRFASGNETQILIRYEDGWAPEPVWTM